MSTHSVLSPAAQPLAARVTEPGGGEGQGSSQGEVAFADFLRQVAGTGSAPIVLAPGLPVLPVLPGDRPFADDAREGGISDAGAQAEAAGWAGLLLMGAGLSALPVSVSGSETGADSNRAAGSGPGPARAPAHDPVPAHPAMDRGEGSQKTAGALVDDAAAPDRRPALAQGGAGSGPVALSAELVAAADDAGQPIAGEAAPRQAAGVSLEGRLPQGLPEGSDGAERSAFAGHEESVEGPLRAGDEGGPGRIALGNDGAMPRSAHRGRADDPAGSGVTGDGRPAAALSADAVRNVFAPRDAGWWGAASAGNPVSVERFAEQAAPVLLRALQMHAGGHAAEARLFLVPEHLGKVDVQLVVHNGHVTIAFAVDTPAAKEALESQIPQLRWQLEQQGLVLDKVSVTQGTSGGLAFFHGFSHGHRGASPYPHSAPRRAHAAYGGEETVESLPTASIRTTGERVSRVDYSV
ncbi:flagellar hook-length control protein FliK [Calditerricola satsumensis]|uniref:Flagellar hook-length control protein-like C-terminal domain-containing protein n=3 Tax=Calditerricola satsumensis TaxID=373054 RepID=A0A8J3B924_9BACI|nr:flagellar hook-length control protein FliK [Calditerricola satsumensis]GGJ97907.1 hypothetical protein GCM10007043_09780 [Calditerricola satsumensis]